MDNSTHSGHTIRLGLDHEVLDGQPVDTDTQAYWRRQDKERIMSGELIEQREEHRELLDLVPSKRLPAAQVIANKLAECVNHQGLSVKIGQTKHVMVTGWSLLGSMCGFMAREKFVIECENGDWLAEVELVRLRDGVVTGGGSAICGHDEVVWFGGKDAKGRTHQPRPRNAARSMAITRATGKAFRIALGWVMPLAGFSETPWEEMQAVEQQGVPVTVTETPVAPTDAQAARGNAFVNLLKEAGTADEVNQLGQQLAGMRESKEITGAQYSELRKAALAQYKDMA